MGAVTVTARPSDTSVERVKEWHIQINGLTDSVADKIRGFQTSPKQIDTFAGLHSLTWSIPGEGLHGSHPPMMQITGFLSILCDMGYELKLKVFETSATPFQGFVWTLVNYKPTLLNDLCQ